MINIRILKTPLSVQKCIDFVRHDKAGGIDVFIGTVRRQTNGKKVIRLDFESYIPMAEKEMKKIAEKAIEQWGALHIAIHHRIGTLSIGEIPVIIAISTPHRKAAFKACRYVIDTLKETVPIWKKEIFEDGEIWVSAHP